jgi:hypothetical protein
LIRGQDYGHPNEFLDRGEAELHLSVMTNSKRDIDGVEPARKRKGGGNNAPFGYVFFRIAPTNYLTSKACSSR